MSNMENQFSNQRMQSIRNIITNDFLPSQLIFMYSFQFVFCSFLLAGAGLNAEVEVIVGKIKEHLSLPNKQPSAALLLLDPPQEADFVKVAVTKIHSKNNNGFQSILVWTQGEIILIYFFMLPLERAEFRLWNRLEMESSLWCIFNLYSWLPAEFAIGRNLPSVTKLIILLSIISKSTFTVS